MLFEKIEAMRKAPRKDRERLVAVATIAIVGAITVVWFFLTLSSFFKKNPPPEQPPAAAQSAPAPAARPAGIQPPFAQ